MLVWQLIRSLRDWAVKGHGLIAEAMKKPSRKTLVKKLDDVVREIVLNRNSKCVVCGSNYRLEPGHIFTRKYYSTRWSLDNVWTQCHSCNLKHVHDTYPFFTWYQKRFGQRKFEELHAKFIHSEPIKDWQLIELYEELKMVLDGKGGDRIFS